MKILGMDSSGLVASVALLSDDILTAEYTVNYKKTHSQTLLPMLDELVKMCDIELEEVDAIAVAAGPGSFTGLRIGSATAKGLGLALDKPLIAVPTTAGLAYNMFRTEGILCPMMDARRSQVYNGLYEFEGSDLVTLEDQRAIGIEDLLTDLTARYPGREVIFIGDGVETYRHIIEERNESRYVFAPPHLSKQRAGAVAALGKRYLELGKAQLSSEYVPSYLRLSQAERERIEMRGRDAGQDNAGK